MSIMPEGPGMRVLYGMGFFYLLFCIVDFLVSLI